MSRAEYERLLAILSDPEYDDGPELPVEGQCDPNDPGVWVIWAGGPVKAGAEASAARAARAWQAIRDAGGCPERGDGMFGRPPGTRGVDAAVPTGEWADAL